MSQTLTTLKADTETSDNEEYQLDITIPEHQLIENWTTIGVDTEPRPKEIAEEHTTFALDTAVVYWESPYDSEFCVGLAKSPTWEDSGYPWAVCTTHSDSNTWKHTHIAETRLQARKSAATIADRREFLRSKLTGEKYHKWVKRTGGTQGTPQIYRTDGFP